MSEPENSPQDPASSTERAAVESAESANGSRPRRIERSCAICHRRKIRCNKKMPCSSCERSGVLCYYPANDQLARRPHKATIADVATRLAVLERTIKAITHDSATSYTGNESGPKQVVAPAVTSILSVGPSTVQGTPTTPNPPMDEILVQNSRSAHYFNDVLLSRVLEEVFLTFSN
jgi:hypothetical protein